MRETPIAMPELDPAQEKRQQEITTVIGGAVIAAAGLERTLVGEVYRQQRLADLPLEDVEAFEKRSGGTLLGKLREQGVDAALAERIADLIVRRNRLIHGFLEDLEVAAALMTGEGFAEVRAGVEQLGNECAALSKEMQAEVGREIEEILGLSLEVIAERLAVADLSQIEDPKQRAELEKARTLIKLTDWPNPPVYEPGASGEAQAPGDAPATG
jgi:hypothetical protein